MESTTAAQSQNTAPRRSHNEQSSGVVTESGTEAQHQSAITKNNTNT